MVICNNDDYYHDSYFNICYKGIKEEMIVNELPRIMIKCLLLTVLIELAIALLIGIVKRRDLLNVILVNVVTNPLVVSLPILFMLLYGVRARYIVLIILELLTVIFEGFIYSKVLDYKKLNPYIISLMLNLGSYLIGEVINRL